MTIEPPGGGGASAIGARSHPSCPGSIGRLGRPLGRRAFIGAAGAFALGWGGSGWTAADYAQVRRGMLDAIADTTARTAASTGVEAIDPVVMAALDRVPRHEFVPPEIEELAYENRPLPTCRELAGS